MSKLIPAASGSIEGTISVSNSTGIPLGAAGVFTGAWEEITDYAIIKVNIGADQDSADLGLRFEQSPDQSVIYDDTYNLKANIGKLYTINPGARYFRIVYTNGLVAQTSFSIQTIYSPVYAKPSSHRIDGVITQDDDAELVKSVISFEDDDDQTYPNVGVQNPMPVSQSFVYVNDVWEGESSTFNFSGSVNDLFNDLKTAMVDITANDPKELEIRFNRTVITDVIGLGAESGNFSNTEVQIIRSGGVYSTVVDESADNTKYTNRGFILSTESGAIGFIGIRFIFHTTDTVTLTNCSIVKVQSVRSRVLGPDGLEYSQDNLTSSRIFIDYDHHERHDGRAFNAFSSQEPVTSLIMAFRVEPAQTREPHIIITWKSEETGAITFYQGATWTAGTGTDFTPLNNYHRFQGVKTSVLQGDASGAFVSNLVTLDPTGFSTAGATIKFEEPVFGTNQQAASGAQGHDQEQILEVGETYAFQIVCANGGAYLFLDWYEHIPKAEP